MSVYELRSERGTLREAENDNFTKEMSLKKILETLYRSGLRC